MNTDKFYITAALPYANENPHIGHAILFLYTDVMARYQRMLGKDVYFVTGTDEHGQKMFRSAKEHGLPVEDYCSEKSAVFQNLADQWNITNDDFIRTTENRHIEAAQKFWLAAVESGDIYKKKYTGLYCVGCEAYKTEKDLVGGKCPDHQKEPEVLEEENYFFRLSKYQEPLELLYEQQPEFVYPQNRYNEMHNILKNGLEDISVSRSTDKLTWGVPVPNDPTQVMYVWFDALTNYITALGYGSTNDTLFNKYWPADAHVVGKEINRFHSLLWPAMLMSAGLELPKMIAAHGWITIDGQKMSKSVGNVIDPLKMSSDYPIDAVRYFFMRELPFDSDGDYSEDKFIARYNGDLANGIGNLTNRIVVMIEKYCAGTVPEVKNIDHEMIDYLKEKIWPAYEENMAKFRFDKALESVWAFITHCDQKISDVQPWAMAKDGKTDEVNDLLYHLAESLRQIAVMIWPIMPEAAERILGQLGVDAGEEFAKPLSTLKNWVELTVGKKISEPEILFPRL
ncbi:MAG: methionine--tRNA ligase [Candidatus Magasanikbacteria bacterium]|nr:methionine--tRNA ligase [Candidatus Magasanikbacteria bacterium]